MPNAIEVEAERLSVAGKLSGYQIDCFKSQPSEDLNQKLY
jgi:hypothetical protein